MLADFQVCCALFAFQMAHEVLCSSFESRTLVFLGGVVTPVNVAISALFLPEFLHDI